jgi:hypothetical protein
LIDLLSEMTFKFAESIPGKKSTEEKKSGSTPNKDKAAKHRQESHST